MKPWREIAIPHADVLKGTFQQAEFAADITAVRTGRAPEIYHHAVTFFARTFITEGMRLLLTQVAQRLSGQGGEPVIQLQTAFGGGKTHTMLAVWHLATRHCPLSDLPGVACVVEKAGLMEVPRANVAVIDGTAHAPGQEWKSGGKLIRTLWGELAWQLGGEDGFAMVAAADASGTSPGKAVLRELLEKYAPCVVLMDELVAYIRNHDLMILPGSLPLGDSEVRNELTYLLSPGWEPVIETDIDGDRAETTALENKEPRFGQVNAARRVARTLFLGTAPSSVATIPGIRGLDRARVLLGCLQPGQAGSVYSDALARLADRLHYLNAGGDKTADATRYWFDTRANLRREMEDRKRRFDEKSVVRQQIEEVAKKLFAGTSLFAGIHVFTPHGDVPDDSAMRLVVLSPTDYYMKEMSRQAEDAVSAYLKSHGNQPRHRANRLLFVAPDHIILNRLRDLTRTAFA